jgi:Protein of unknown function (DUF2815)
MPSMKKPGKTKSKAEKDLCRIITPEFRVSFPHVFKPQAPKPKDTPKYSITMLFPKGVELKGTSPDGEPRTLKEVMRNAKVAAFGPDKDEWPELESPVNDGDDPKYADKEGYKGHWVIKASTSQDQKPSVVDREMNVITDPAELYPGCYARAYVFARDWEYMGKKGIQFILDHVQKTREGKSFGGKKPVEQVFKPLPANEDDGNGAEVEDF